MGAHPGWDADNMDADAETCITTEHAARKQHQCSACPEPIKPGQRYLRHYFPPSAVYREHADPSTCYFADPETGAQS